MQRLDELVDFRIALREQVSMVHKFIHQLLDSSHAGHEIVAVIREMVCDEISALDGAVKLRKEFSGHDGLELSDQLAERCLERCSKMLFNARPGNRSDFRKLR